MGTVPAEQLAALARLNGTARSGVIHLRDFDLGMVTTLGGVLWNNGYYLPVPGIDFPDAPGIPIHWADPEDVYVKYKLPSITLRRDSTDFAVARYHSGAGKYRAPAETALPRTVQVGNQLQYGYDRMEICGAAVPFDFMYTIDIRVRHPQALPQADEPQIVGLGARSMANLLLERTLAAFPPYGWITVTDSLGDTRQYSSFMEGTAPADEAADMAVRKLSYMITVRVEGELDLSNPEVRRTITSMPVVTLTGR
jgi:hypothetical protein